MRRQKSTRRLNLTWIKTLVLIILPLWGIVFIHERLFKTSNLSCNLDSTPCSTEVSKLLSPYRGQLLYRLDTSQFTKSLNQQFPNLSVSNIELFVPGTMKVVLTHTPIVAAITDSSQSKTLFITSEYRLIDKSVGAPQLPFIVDPDLIDKPVGTTLTTAKDQTVLHLYQQLQQKQIKFTKLIIPSSTTAQVQLTSSLTLYLSLDGDLESQLNNAVLILNHLSGNETAIDLRYTKPVVRY
jgi:cell division septal protein FtsQ